MFGNSHVAMDRNQNSIDRQCTFKAFLMLILIIRKTRDLSNCQSPPLLQIFKIPGNFIEHWSGHFITKHRNCCCILLEFM